MNDSFQKHRTKSAHLWLHQDKDDTIHPISVPRSEIKVGQVIWATLVLDVASVPPKALRKKPQSTTVQRCAGIQNYPARSPLSVSET